MSSLIDFIRTVDIKDYVSKQIRYSIGNIPSIPIGLVLIYSLTTYGHLWYIFSSLVSWVMATGLNFNMQILFKVVSNPTKNTEYFSKIIRFYVGSMPLVPLGTGLLYAFTEYGHVFYLISTILSMICTTTIGMAIQTYLKVVKVKQKTS